MLSGVLTPTDPSRGRQGDRTGPQPRPRSAGYNDARPTPTRERRSQSVTASRERRMLQTDDKNLPSLPLTQVPQGERTPDPGKGSRKEDQTRKRSNKPGQDPRVTRSRTRDFFGRLKDLFSDNKEPNQSLNSEMIIGATRSLSAFAETCQGDNPRVRHQRSRVALERPSSRHSSTDKARASTDSLITIDARPESIKSFDHQEASVAEQSKPARKVQFDLKPELSNETQSKLKSRLNLLRSRDPTTSGTGNGKGGILAHPGTTYPGRLHPRTQSEAHAAHFGDAYPTIAESLIGTAGTEPEDRIASGFSLNVSGLGQHPRVSEFAYPPEDQKSNSTKERDQKELEEVTETKTGKNIVNKRSYGNFDRRRYGIVFDKSPVKETESGFELDPTVTLNCNENQRDSEDEDRSDLSSKFQ